MPNVNQVLILIGLPGAGKTTVAAHLVERLRARHVQIEAYRDRGATAAEIADDLARAASAEPIIFECSGASHDFEEILQHLAANEITCFVANLDVTAATALERLASRVPPKGPKVGRVWTEHVEWVDTRLGLVPTDFDVDAEICSSEEAAAAVICAWNARDKGGAVDATLDRAITFSQLSKWQVCGREYRYRYIWGVAPTAALPPIVEVGEAAHGALAWLFAPGAVERPLDGLLDAFESKIKADNRESTDRARAWIRQLLSTFYARRYMTDDARTLAVEPQVTLPLSPTLSVVGRLDRLSMNPAGELEVTEFKLRQTRRGSRPRVPGLLQPAAYAAAVMGERQARRAFARLHFLDQDRAPRVLLTGRGAQNVRLAMLRWVTSLRAQGLAARPGYHCRHCGYRLVCPWSTSRTSANLVG
jgi:hypothetical protein